MKKWISWLLIFTLVFASAGCISALAEQVGIRGEENVDGESGAMETYSFDEDLFQYISSVTEGSFMISPLSFRYAIGLLLIGAEGETKAELMAAMGISSEEEWEVLCAAFNGFMVSYGEGVRREMADYETYMQRGWLPPESKAPSRALRVADSVWKRQDLPAEFSAGFCEKADKIYGAEYFDFTADSAAEGINGWVNEKTEGLIPALVPANYDASRLAVVLMNVLYFKDCWVDEFPARLTAEGDFTKADGTLVRKEFMHNEEHYDYYEDADTQMVIIPMKGGVKMAFLLGDAKGFTWKIASAGRAKVQVTIPKMDLETSFNRGELTDYLKTRGVQKAFDPEEADFSAMLDYPVWVDDIIQKTRIRTDETGVEAAAATAMMVCGAAMPLPVEPKVFIADRPFSFFIYTETDGVPCIMFAGSVRD